MAAARKLRSGSLSQAVRVEVTASSSAPFQAVRQLDLDRLARSRRAVVELGRFDVECCKRTARAIVKTAASRQSSSTPATIGRTPSTGRRSCSY